MRIRQATDRALSWVARNTGVNALMRKLTQSQLLVLCYHGIVSRHSGDSDGQSAILVSDREFSEQMEVVAQRFQPITLAELRHWREGNGQLKRNPVLITFDDGYRNNLTHAAPVLRRLGIPAVFHVCTGYLETKRLPWPTELYCRVMGWSDPKFPLPNGSWIGANHVRSHRIALAVRLREGCKSLPFTALESYLNKLRATGPVNLEPGDDELFGFLSWHELSELHRQGFEIGSHGFEHSILTRVSSAQLEHELQESKRTLEGHLSAPCLSFAYPNGQPADVSLRVLEATRSAGYQFAFTTFGGFTRRPTNDSPGEALLLGRICISGKLSRSQFEGRISGLHAVLKRTPQPKWLHTSHMESGAAHKGSLKIN